jgi:hypothetical protein
MNHSHHDHCDHVLKHCAKCDVVYCTKCNEEWPKTKYVYDYYKYYEQKPYSPWYPYTVTYGATTTNITSAATSTTNTEGCKHG